MMASFSTRVTVGQDDCHDLTNGTFTSSATYSVFGISGSTFTPGYRFLNVTIPQGATILSATITIQASNNDTIGNIYTNIYAWNADTAGVFDNSGGVRPRDVPVTTAVVNWTLGGWSAGSNYTTSDLSTVVQEIVDRVGWASGNNMAFVFRPSAGTNAYRRAKTYEAGSSYAPLLSITYSIPPPSVSGIQTITGVSSITF